MAYEIAIYQSGNLTSYCYSEHGTASAAQDRIATYLNGINDRFTEDVFDVVTPSTTIPAPTEFYDKSFTTDDPCSEYQRSFGGLLAWWQEYTDCKINPAGADSNLLITNAVDGGVAEVDGGRAGIGGTRAVAQTGNKIPELPNIYDDSTKSGDSRPHSALDTALHEIFHNLTRSDIYDMYPDYEDPPHQLGEVSTNRYGNTVLSPLADTFGAENICGTQIPSTDNREHTLGSCTNGHTK